MNLRGLTLTGRGGKSKDERSLLRWMWFTILLLIAGPTLSIFTTYLTAQIEGETMASAFSRSGAVLAAMGAAAMWSASETNKRRIPQYALAPSNNETLNKKYFKSRHLEKAGLFVVIIGSVVWAYGDLIWDKVLFG